MDIQEEARVKPSILIVDDEAVVRHSLSDWLRDQDYEVVTARNGEEALKKLKKKDFNVAVIDLKMPDIDGIELLKHIRKINPNTDAVIMTAYATVDSAVKAMKEGAQDYVMKPFSPEELDLIIKRILERQSILQENIILKQELKGRFSFANLIGKSHQMQKIYSLIEKIALSNATVLIQGESGTGKELVARAIHYASPRKDKPFVTTSCGALPETILESELFGYERGAFTGAVTRKLGRFELANGGTLFLDEIAEMSLKSQVDLLRVLEEKEIHRLGGTKPIKIDVRIIAATNKNLEEEVKRGNFREDLYYRLQVIPLVLPPLRERKEDIPLLVRHFLGKFKDSEGEEKKISPEAMEALLRYNWPGNVRELENAIEQAVLLGRGNTIQLEHLPEKIYNRTGQGIATPVDGFTFKDKVEAFERQLILEALRKSNGIKGSAAKLLGISQRNLSYYLKKFGLE